MIVSERKYLASCENSEDFLLSPHHTSRLLKPENYSASNYRTLIKVGVAENRKGMLPWHFCNKKNDIPHLAGVWRKWWQDNGYDGTEVQRASCSPALINTALLLCDKYISFGVKKHLSGDRGARMISVSILHLKISTFMSWLHVIITFTAQLILGGSNHLHPLQYLVFLTSEQPQH